MKTAKVPVRGAWVLSNSSSLNMYEVQHDVVDNAVVGLNNGPLEVLPIEYDLEDGDRAYVTWSSSRYYFDECLKV